MKNREASFGEKVLRSGTAVLFALGISACGDSQPTNATDEQAPASVSADQNQSTQADQAPSVEQRFFCNPSTGVAYEANMSKVPENMTVVYNKNDCKITEENNTDKDRTPIEGAIVLTDEEKESLKNIYTLPKEEQEIIVTTILQKYGANINAEKGNWTPKVSREAQEQYLENYIKWSEIISGIALDDLDVALPMTDILSTNNDSNYLRHLIVSAKSLPEEYIDKEDFLTAGSIEVKEVSDVSVDYEDGAEKVRFKILADVKNDERIITFVREYINTEDMGKVLVFKVEEMKYTSS